MSASVSGLPAYGRNAPAILAQGYGNYVQNTVTNDGAGWWYSFTVTVSNFDDSGHALVRVGDQAVVLARPGSGAASATFLLKRGKEYEIHVIPDQIPRWESSPLNDSCPSVARSNGSVSVIWPPVLDLTPADCHFGTITHTWRQIFTATIRDCHPDLVSARIWSAARGYVSIAASPNGPATVSWTNIVEGTLMDTLYCDALIDGHLWRGAASLFYETPEGALPHVELAAADTIFCNDDDDNANGTNDYADTAFITGEDDDLIPVTVSFKSDIPTNADLRLSIPSGGLRLWRTRNHAEELTPPLIWENVSAPTSIIVYAERENITSDQPDDIVVQAEWLADGQSIARTRSSLTAIEPDMQPITAREDDLGSVCNPALVATGENAVFHVDVWPDDYPSSKIVWSSSSDAISFLNGTTGTTVTVQAGHQGLATLSVTFGDCPSSRPQVTTEVIDESIVKIQPWIVGPKGLPAHTTPEIVSNFVSSANRLFRQAAIRFVLDDFHYLTNSSYAVLTLDGNGRCIDGERMLDTTNCTQKIEVYFVDAINGFADGFANEDGVIISSESTWKAFAHELGHACGLRDIFDARNGVSVTGLPSRGFEPEDWNNGTGCRYYPRTVLQSELIDQLLMYWRLTSSPGGDLPRGTVEGIWYEWRSNTVTRAWEQLQHPQSPVAVGCSSINRHPVSE